MKEKKVEAQENQGEEDEGEDKRVKKRANERRTGVKGSPMWMKLKVREWLKTRVWSGDPRTVCLFVCLRELPPSHFPV